MRTNIKEKSRRDERIVKEEIFNNKIHFPGISKGKRKNPLSSDFCLFISVFCLLSSVFCLLPNSSHASFDFNPNCQKAMQSLLDLKPDDAHRLIEDEKKANPQNGFHIYLEHYSDCIELIVTENITVYERLIDSYDDRMDRMDKLDDGSPYNSWLQAEMLFQTGLAQVKFGTRINGVYKMLSAYDRLKQNRKKYPQFWQNLKLTGVYNIILDNIPPIFRWAADIFGFSGDTVLGTYQLQEYFNHAKKIPGLAEEGLIFNNLGFLLAKQEEQAFEAFRAQDESLKKLTLVRYLYANAATFIYRNDLALEILKEIKPEQLQVKFYALPYAMGRCKLNHIELDAKDYFEDFLMNYSVLDYKKASCNRLAYCYLLKGDLKKYEEYKAKVFVVGQALRDRDREAVLESSEKLIPHIGLLKARLLCDGGYFNDALEIMKTIRPDQLGEEAYKLEYHYRMGRIMQLSGKSDQAIPELTKAYDYGKSIPLTFATRSALQLGLIYEEMKNYTAALQWYQNCLETYDPSHTTDGIEQMAQKGIKRVK